MRTLIVSLTVIGGIVLTGCGDNPDPLVIPASSPEEIARVEADPLCRRVPSDMAGDIRPMWDCAEGSGSG